MAVELSLPNKTKVAFTDTTYATVAESLMKDYMQSYNQQRNFEKLTTTKLRSIYALIANVSAQVTTEEDYEGHRPDIQYLKVRMAYEAGREQQVRAFLDKTGLMDLVNGITSFEQFRLYCRYAEALVAYFKYFGGKDK